MAKKKYYVVWKGHKPGIYNFWSDVEKQVKGFKGAKYKAFKSKEDAKAAFSNPLNASLNTKDKPTGIYMTVDAAFSAHTTEISEWRGVIVDNGEEREIFRSRAYKGGSANVGEFLSIIQAIKYLSFKDLDMPIYSDSHTALVWMDKKSHNSKVDSSPALTELLNKANTYLLSDAYEKIKDAHPLSKWDTKAWGEIPADFGRKNGKGLAVSEEPAL